MSHTVRVKVEFNDEEALGRAVQALGGQVLGQGHHRFYDGMKTGLGLRLPGWVYPLVVEDGMLAFDAYRGAWGKLSDIPRLTGRYVVERAKARAAELGWVAEETAQGLTIYHPSGNAIMVDAAGVVDAHGFAGQGCAQATAAVVEALGTETEETLKDEWWQVDILQKEVE